MFRMFMPILYCIMIMAAVPVIIMYSIRESRKKNNNRNTGSANAGRGYNMPGDGSRPGNMQANRQGNMYGNARGNMQGNVQRSMAGNASGNRSSVKQGGSSGKAAENKTAGSSTTEYLEKKAMEDQREHAVEKMEEQRRVNAKYGNLPIARRHILGDPVPSGMKIVCCGYCGAENEVKAGSRGRLGCYFCRTEL